MARRLGSREQHYHGPGSEKFNSIFLIAVVIAVGDAAGPFAVRQRHVSGLRA
jgi:hypothetical protein